MGVAPSTLKGEGTPLWKNCCRPQNDLSPTILQLIQRKAKSILLQDRTWPVSAAKARVAGSKKAQCSPWHDLMLREAAQVRATFLAAWRTVRSCLSANAARRGLIANGFPEYLIASVSGLSDTKPLRPDAPYLPQNRRLSIVVLVDERP